MHSDSQEHTHADTSIAVAWFQNQNCQNSVNSCLSNVLVSNLEVEGVI